MLYYDSRPHPSTIFSVMHESTRKFNWFIVVCGVIQKNSPENVNAGWLAGKIVLYGKYHTPLPFDVRWLHTITGVGVPISGVYIWTMSE